MGPGQGGPTRPDPTRPDLIHVSERLVALDVAADAVTPAYLPATAADLHLTHSMRPSMAGGVQSVPLVLHTRCSQVILEVRGHVRSCQRHIPFYLRFLGRSGTGNLNPL